METWNVKLKFCYMHNILRFLRARQTLVETDKLGTLIMVDSNENKCSKKKFSCTFFLIYVSKVFFLSNSSPMSKVQTSILGLGVDFVSPCHNKNKIGQTKLSKTSALRGLRHIYID